MTDEESIEMVKRLVKIQHRLRDFIEGIEEHGNSMAGLGEPGLAFAIYMVGESMHVYSKEIRKLIKRAIRNA